MGQPYPASRCAAPGGALPVHEQRLAGRDDRRGGRPRPRPRRTRSAPRPDGPRRSAGGRGCAAAGGSRRRRRRPGRAAVVPSASTTPSPSRCTARPATTVTPASAGVEVGAQPGRRRGRCTPSPGPACVQRDGPAAGPGGDGGLGQVGGQLGGEGAVGDPPGPPRRRVDQGGAQPARGAGARRARGRPARRRRRRRRRRPGSTRSGRGSARRQLYRSAGAARRAPSRAGAGFAGCATCSGARDQVRRSAARRVRGWRGPGRWRAAGRAVEVEPERLLGWFDAVRGPARRPVAVDGHRARRAVPGRGRRVGGGRRAVRRPAPCRVPGADPTGVRRPGSDRPLVGAAAVLDALHAHLAAPRRVGIVLVRLGGLQHRGRGRRRGGDLDDRGPARARAQPQGRVVVGAVRATA